MSGRQTESIEWIPVTETLPDDDLTVLLAFDADDPWLGWHTDGRWFDVSGAEVDEVTHWAEPPMGPK